MCELLSAKKGIERAWLAVALWREGKGRESKGEKGKEEGGGRIQRKAHGKGLQEGNGRGMTDKVRERKRKKVEKQEGRHTGKGSAVAVTKAKK